MPGKIKSPDFNVTIDNEANYQPTYWYTVTNKDAPKVQITKKSNATQDILDLSAYTVSGAEFGIYSDQWCTQKVGTATTGQNGVTNTITLPCQSDGTYTYWVREDKEPNGHKENKTPQAITVTLPADAGATKQMTFTDEPETETLSAVVEKRSEKGTAVDGAVFEVKLYDGVYNSVEECELSSKLKKTWYLKSIKSNVGNQGLVEFKDENVADDINNSYRSDSFYTLDNKIVIPIGCTVTFKEVYAPGKYVLDSTTKLWSENNQSIQMIRYYNDLTPCKINIVKLSPDGKTPLQGVQFELTFVKESEPYTADASPDFSRLLKQGESITAETDANGKITWDNLDQGEYQITEIKTKSGMSLLKDPINITLPITMSNAQAKSMSAATDNGVYDEVNKMWNFYEATFEVTNTPTFKMPTTGATGMWKFIIFGFGTMSILVTGLVIYDFRKKRIRKYKRK